MTMPFHQVEPWVGDFLSELRGRGLAGNIIQDSPAQLAGEEQALWTGERHQLAFVGEPGNFKLELRRFDDSGHWEAIREEKDPEKFNMIVIDFCVREG